MWKYPKYIRMGKKIFTLNKVYPAFGLYENIEHNYRICLSMHDILDLSRKKIRFPDW